MTKKHITISTLDAEFCLRALELQSHFAQVNIGMAERYGDLACLERNEQVKAQADALQAHLRNKIGAHHDK